jgi:hypothetical protein
MRVPTVSPGISPIDPRGYQGISLRSPGISIPRWSTILEPNRSPRAIVRPALFEHDLVPKSLIPKLEFVRTSR